MLFQKLPELQKVAQMQWFHGDLYMDRWCGRDGCSEDLPSSPSGSDKPLQPKPMFSM